MREFKPTKNIDLKRLAVNDEKKAVEIIIPLAIHSGSTGRILVNSPGLGCSKDGENNQFKKVGNRIQVAGIASVIRYQSSLGDFAFKKVSIEPLLMDNLRAVVDYALKEAKAICGSAEPELFLAGHSAGASTSAAIAFEYPQISRMLLIAPSVDIDPNLLKRSLSQYSGELFMVSGDKDHVINPEAARIFIEWAERAKSKSLITLKDCDHNFSGLENQRHLVEAYIRAFSKDQPKGTRSPKEEEAS